jgi:hypothetical protein
MLRFRHGSVFALLGLAGAALGHLREDLADVSADHLEQAQVPRRERDVLEDTADAGARERLGQAGEGGVEVFAVGGFVAHARWITRGLPAGYASL